MNIEKRNNRTKDYYNRIYRELKTGFDNGLTLSELCNSLNVYKDYFYDYIRRYGREALLINNITQEEYDDFASLYTKIKNNNKPVKRINNNDDEIVDNATYGVIIRDDEGLVDHYEFGVHNRNNQFVNGEISRELMDRIYSLYSKEGINLTQRTVSRDILLELDIDFYTFQQILKVFKITKSSIPFAPHVLEENSVDNVIDKTFQLKENLFFKRIEEDKIKRIEQKNIHLLAENIELKNKLVDFNEWVQSIDFSNVEVENIKVDYDSNDRALVVFLSDIHIGAMVSNDSLYENFYNPEEVLRRFALIEQKIANLVSCFGFFERIIVINLGDSLDGFNNQTARGGHHLPQNLTNKEQFEFYIKLIQKFIDDLWQSGLASAIDYYSVGDSNHDGINGYLANRLLEEYFKVKYPGMIACTFQKFIDFINYGRHTLILTHGKDGGEMFKNYPLYIDDKTENKINEFIDYNFDSSIWNQNVVVCKGDLHQSATSYAKRFTYKSVSSIFGSSGWVQKNFGNTKPAVDFLVLGREDKNDVIETRLILK
jgi:hypothetical protein